MEIVDVWLEPKTVRPGYITGQVELEVKGTIKLKGIKFEFNAGELRVTLPPNCLLYTSPSPRDRG